MTAPGYCKACSSPLVKEINKRLARNDALVGIAEWCGKQGFAITRQKLGDHKAHITDPRTTFVEKARRNPEIRNGVTNDEFLQAVIDAAASRAELDPDAITITHGLKAVQVREARKEKSINVLLLLAETFTGKRLEQRPQPMIEGSWSEVPAPDEENP